MGKRMIPDYIVDCEIDWWNGRFWIKAIGDPK